MFPLLISLYLCIGFCVGQFQPTRPIDIWDPFQEKTTTPLPPDQFGREQLAENEVIIKLGGLGSVVGTQMTLRNLSWTTTRDVRDNIDPTRGRSNPNPLPVNNDVTIFTFLGIPYALPPTANRRFKPPQLITRFGGDRDLLRANKFKAACAQDIDKRPTLWYDIPYEFNTDEDCLYLNIFTPQVSLSVESNYPVIVFFHGGGFQYGSANDWPGFLLATKGMVVVTANYRLGAFGFASLGDSSTGNYGLLDQNLVLKWVNMYISSFQGDSGRVTIVGHGAGAVSAGLHMQMRPSEGLFHSVAALSGAEVSYHQVITKPALAYNNTIKLGREAGCTTGQASDIWSCLLTRSTNDIIQATASMLIEFNRYAFLPTVDGKLLPDAPQKVLERKEIRTAVPYLTGVNANDGTEVLLSQRDLVEYDFHVDQPFVDTKILDYVIKRNYTENKEAVMDAIKYKYTYWPDTQSDYHIRQQFINFATDAYYVSPVSLSAHLHSGAGSFTYMYVNNYNMSHGSHNTNENLFPDWMGVSHEIDLYLLFGFPWMPKELLPLHLRDVQWTQYDKNASEVFMTIIKQFAKINNPNLQFEGQWVNLDQRRHFYLDFNVTRQLKRDYDWQHVAFWNNYVHHLALLFTTTFSPTEATLRKELVIFKSTTGAFIALCCALVVLAGAFAYMLFERRNIGRYWNSVGSKRHILAHNSMGVSEDVTRESISTDAYGRAASMTPMRTINKQAYPQGQQAYPQGQQAYPQGQQAYTPYEGTSPFPESRSQILTNV